MLAKRVINSMFIAIWKSSILLKFDFMNQNKSLYRVFDKSHET